MTLNIERVDSVHASRATGIVIVIDVIRAFSVAGYAFAAGAEKMWLVRTIEEAHAMRKREPHALLAGEVGGRLIEGFELNNSPSQMMQAPVQGRTIIQRTGAGTQGAVNAHQARSILLCALTNAQATADYARMLANQTGDVITFLPTATINGETPHNEDDICADYVQALIEGSSEAETILQQGISYLQTSGRFDAWLNGYQDLDLPAADVPAILDVNRLHFAMVGTPQQWQKIEYVEVIYREI